MKKFSKIYLTVFFLFTFKLKVTYEKKISSSYSVVHFFFAGALKT